MQIPFVEPEKDIFCETYIYSKQRVIFSKWAKQKQLQEKIFQ